MYSLNVTSHSQRIYRRLKLSQLVGHDEVSSRRTRMGMKRRLASRKWGILINSRDFVLSFTVAGFRQRDRNRRRGAVSSVCVSRVSKEVPLARLYRHSGRVYTLLLVILRSSCSVQHVKTTSKGKVIMDSKPTSPPSRTYIPSSTSSALPPKD